ncbi:TPA: hypothetical protein ACQKR9_001260 [Streptococcus pyogenes]|nr:hypothetical protein [Streptococcus pyogenes]HER7518952.1 hypothetical protein [Streptococcus pyogenes]
MKTRSKRFLNLATLSLALLGTTLLMAQPVKAEGVQIVDRDRSTEQENIKKNYMERLGLSNLTGQYDKDRFEGYLDGYNKGRQPGAPKSPEKTKRYDPESENPSDGYSTNEDRDREFGQQKGIDDGKNGYWPNVNRQEITIPKGIDYPDEYRDGYQEGYSQGWHQEHPLLGVIFDVFDSIWNVMSGLFNGVN